MIDVACSLEPLDWDYEADTSIVMKNMKIWNIVLVFIVVCSLYFALFCCYNTIETPDYLGNIAEIEYEAFGMKFYQAKEEKN